jgi:hypothetical protein
MRLPYARFVVPLCVAALLAGASAARAAADVIIDEIPAAPPAPRPQVQFMPPQLRLQMQQVQEALEQAQAGGFGGNAGARVLQIYPGGRSRNVVVVADQRGTVEIREAGGKGCRPLLYFWVCLSRGGCSSIG